MKDNTYFKSNTESFDILNLELDIKLACKFRSFAPLFKKILIKSPYISCY